MATVVNPVIRCECGQPTQLPLSIPERTSESLLARIPDNWQLDFVCPDCKRKHVYSSREIALPIDVEGVRSANLPGTVLWRLEFECGHESCESHVVTHTVAFADSSQRVLLDIVAGAEPALTCEKGHPLSVPTIPKATVVKDAFWK